MTTAIIPSASSVPVADQGSSMALSVAKNLLTRDYPSDPGYLLEPLKPADRVALERRKAMLDHWLLPASREDYPRLTKAIAEMMGSFGAGSSSEKAVVAKWLQVVSDLPSWAILRACALIESGDAEGASLDYRPSAPRLKAVARDVMAPWLEELAQLRAVLAVKALEPEDAAMRARVGALLRGLASELRGTARVIPQPDAGEQFGEPR